jgi:hypothetical protein
VLKNYFGFALEKGTTASKPTLKKSKRRMFCMHLLADRRLIFEERGRLLEKYQMGE